MRRIQVSFYGTPEAGQGRCGLCVTERRLEAVVTTIHCYLQLSSSFLLSFFFPSVNHQRERAESLMAAERCNICHRARSGHDVASRGGGKRSSSRRRRIDECSRRLELDNSEAEMKCKLSAESGSSSFPPTGSASPSQQTTCTSLRRVPMPLENTKQQ